MSEDGKLNLGVPARKPGATLIEDYYQQRTAHRRKHYDPEQDLDEWKSDLDDLEEAIFRSEAETLEDVARKLDVLASRLLGEARAPGNNWDYIGAASARDDLRRLIAAQGEQ